MELRCGRSCSLWGSRAGPIPGLSGVPRVGTSCPVAASLLLWPVCLCVPSSTYKDPTLSQMVSSQAPQLMDVILVCVGCGGLFLTQGTVASGRGSCGGAEF